VNASVLKFANVGPHCTRVVHEMFGSKGSVCFCPNIVGNCWRIVKNGD
jgi:hypothetical protein